MTSAEDIASSFIKAGPPGELLEVVNDIKTLTSDQDPNLISKLGAAFEHYNEEQLAATKLPGSSQNVRRGDNSISLMADAAAGPHKQVQ
jgi:capping protein (actin filament) muscle Z-line, alpha